MFTCNSLCVCLWEILRKMPNLIVKSVRKQIGGEQSIETCLFVFLNKLRRPPTATWWYIEEKRQKSRHGQKKITEEDSSERMQ